MITTYELSKNFVPNRDDNTALIMMRRSAGSRGMKLDEATLKIIETNDYWRYECGLKELMEAAN